MLEDFHKLPEIERRGLSQVMKIFMDFAADYRSLKTIAIGAVGTAREVVALEPEMREPGGGDRGSIDEWDRTPIDY